MSSFRLIRVCCAAILQAAVLSTAIPAAAQQGTAAQPHDVAVLDGSVVATSLGGDHVAILFNGDSTPTYYNLYSPSWGVCIADSVAYITLPAETHLAKFDFRTSQLSQIATVPKGCTEIIADKSAETLYVANVGASPALDPADQWMNCVLEVDISGAIPSVVDTLLTERQPRALALSPNDSILFVGTVQGACGRRESSMAVLWTGTKTQGADSIQPTMAAAL